MKKEEVYSPPPLPPKAISPQTRYLRTIAAFKTRWQNRSMKTLLAFFSGALVTTLAVVLAGGYHAAMLVLGGFLTVVGLTAIVWALGIPRVARWLLALDSANSETVYVERGVPRANAGKLLAVPYRPRRAPARRALGSGQSADAVPTSRADRPGGSKDGGFVRGFIQEGDASASPDGLAADERHILNRVHR